jgi:NAD(P)-dependent dehydrogenase (short-subunit alcohol dehydrogenase family)
MDHDLTEKVIVITGASSGFGRGAALEFAKVGARVVHGRASWQRAGGARS